MGRQTGEPRGLGGPHRTPRRVPVRSAWHGDYRDGVEEIDRKILSLLCQDGRMSFTDCRARPGFLSRPPTSGCGGWNGAA